MRKSFFIAAALAVGLVGCQTFDETVQNNLPKACAVVASAHAAFVVVASTGKLSASLILSEKQAVAALTVVCADPASVNSSTALIIAANAFAAWNAAGVQ